MVTNFNALDTPHLYKIINFSSITKKMILHLPHLFAPCAHLVLVSSHSRT
jgi:hypothetical protein